MQDEASAPPRARLTARRVLLALVAAVLLGIGGLMSLLLIGGVIVAIFGGKPCAFDPPPGDVTDMSLVNDSNAPVEFVECSNGPCTRFSRVDDGDVVAAGSADGHWNHEDCGREPVGIRDSSGVLLGCIILPVDDPPKVTTWRVSHKVACTGPVG